MNDNNTTSKRTLGAAGLALLLALCVATAPVAAHDTTLVNASGITVSSSSSYTSPSVDAANNPAEVSVTVSQVDSAQILVKGTYNGNTATYQTINISSTGTHNVTLDQSIDTDSYEFVVQTSSSTDVLVDSFTVSASNDAPIADAGTDKTATVGDSVSFDASNSSDPNGDTLTHTWEGPDTTTVTGVAPSFTFDESGTYTVNLTVEDEHGATATDSVQVTVEAQTTTTDDSTTTTTTTPSDSTTTEEPDTYAVDFTVTGDNGTVVENATVEVGNESAETDSDGVASIENVTEGNYSVSVDHASYDVVSENVTVDSNLSVDANLADGNITVSEQSDDGLGGGGGIGGDGNTALYALIALLVGGVLVAFVAVME